VKLLLFILSSVVLFSCIAEEKATGNPQVGDYRVCVEAANQPGSLYAVKEGCYRFARYIEIENDFFDKGLVKIHFEVVDVNEKDLVKIKGEISSVPFVLKVDVKRL
jgi:hypothetical protein